MRKLIGKIIPQDQVTLARMAPAARISGKLKPQNQIKGKIKA